MDFNLKIKIDNAAFQDDMCELTICLKHIAAKIILEKDSGVVRDSNGDVVGSYDDVMGSWVIS